MKKTLLKKLFIEFYKAKLNKKSDKKCLKKMKNENFLS